MTDILDPTVGLAEDISEHNGNLKRNKRKREEIEIRRYVKQHALKCYPVEEEDAVTFLSIFVEAGLVDCHMLTGNCYDPFVDMVDYSDIFETDEDHRITELSLGRQRSTLRPWEFHKEGLFDLLKRLEKLETLKLSNCSTFELTETLSRFPNLKVLEVSSCKTIVLRPRPAQNIYEDKCTETSFPKLEKLTLPDYHMDSPEELADFLFDVLPSVPNLTEFKIASNKIRSFQGIAKRIRDNNERRTDSRLRVLNLGQCKCDTAHDHWLIMQSQLECTRFAPRNGGTLDLREQDLEVEAMQIFLLAYRELQTVIRDAHMDRFFGWKPRASITYLMEINHAGRVLVEGDGSCNKKSTKSRLSNPTTRNSLPLSAWPLVLERAWKWNHPSRFYRHGKNVNGIYYLLQNVEALRAAGQRKCSPNATANQCDATPWEEKRTKARSVTMDESPLPLQN